jgi:hypothetical protein
MAEESSGRRALNDVHGVMVFECEPSPIFVTVSAKAKVGKPVERFLALLNAAADSDLTMSDKDELAFDLYSAVAAHLAQLVATTRNADDIPQNERDALVGSLRGLQQESVGQAGRRLARSLGEREYMGESPPTFFARCYELRSALVHGHYPRPEPGEVGTRAANLEGFVGDLLGGPLLDAATPTA